MHRNKVLERRDHLKRHILKFSIYMKFHINFTPHTSALAIQVGIRQRRPKNRCNLRFGRQQIADLQQHSSRHADY